MSRLFLLLLFTATVAHADDTHGDRIWPSPYAQGVELDQVTLFEDGQKLDLADISDDAPVIAVRYLGYGCEHCVQQLTYLNEHASELKKLGIRVIAFSEDDYELNERLIS